MPDHLHGNVSADSAVSGGPYVIFPKSESRSRAVARDRFLGRLGWPVLAQSCRSRGCPFPGAERTCQTAGLRSHFDAVDGSSTGTSVPWMWALLRLPRFRGASHADDNDNRFRHRQVGFPGSRR